MPAKILHLDLYGKRQSKYDTLESLTLADALWTEVSSVAPYYFFVPKNTDGQGEYEAGFGVNEVFMENGLGAMTGRDDFTLFTTKQDLELFQSQILGFSEGEMRHRYPVGKDSSNWSLGNAISDLKSKDIYELGITFTYRPFDQKYTLYTGKSSGFHSRPQERIGKHFIQKNYALVLGRAGQNVGGEYWNLVFIANSLCDLNLFYRGGATMLPLYLYSETPDIEGNTKTPNLDPVIWAKIDESVGRETSPEEVLDYIYAVLHSPKYREKYREFLKIDFPRVPYPTSGDSFDALVKLGGELRGLHLLESPKVYDFITTFLIVGSGEVEKIAYVDGRAYINSTQYFGDVPPVAWNHYIGGYQPAQKWLKDRKGRTLTWEDIIHYQSMIVALTETARVMGEIDHTINNPHP